MAMATFTEVKKSIAQAHVGILEIHQKYFKQSLSVFI